MNEVMRLLALLGAELVKQGMAKVVATHVGPIDDSTVLEVPGDVTEIKALTELMRQRSEASAQYHTTPRGQAALESADAHDQS